MAPSLKRKPTRLIRQLSYPILVAVVGLTVVVYQDRQNDTVTTRFLNFDPPPPSSSSRNATLQHAVLHVHVEKTGGTSVSLGLAQGVPNAFTDHDRFGGLFLRDFVDLFQHTERVGTARIQVCQNHSFSEKAIQWIAATSQEQQAVDGCKVYLVPTPSVASAHPSVVPGTEEWKQSLEILRRWYPSPLTATVLRKPDARTESHWHHFSRGELHHPHDLALDEWISYCKMMGSLYVSRFSTVPVDLSPVDTPSRFLEINRHAVDSAIATLRNNFDIVGRTECLQEFVSHAKALVTNSRVSAQTYRTNVANNKVTKNPVEGEYLRTLSSPLDGGYVLDHLVFNEFFGDDHYSCSVGSGSSNGIRSRSGSSAHTITHN